MNLIKGLSKAIAGSAGIFAIALGLSTPALAGAILSDFTAVNPYGPIADSAYQETFGAADSLSTAPMTFYLLPEIGANLAIQGFRTNLVDNYGADPSYQMKLSRRTAANEVNTDNRGINLCSTWNGTRCRSSESSTAVNSGYEDAARQDESVRFSIADGFDFAVQYFVFGDVGFAELNGNSNDNARLYYGGNEFDVGGVESFIDFNIRTAANSATADSIAGCELDSPFNPTSGRVGPFDRTCTVDIYDIVRGLATVADDAADDFVFDFLQSDYFRFAAIGIDDDWYARGAQWVVADEDTIDILHLIQVPEPASITLMSAGLLGLGYFGKRRARYAFVRP
ncbi:MAG: PEP-CTERM sorting domain-containing protein [Alphaproteobacteria bacterium]